MVSPQPVCDSSVGFEVGECPSIYSVKSPHCPPLTSGGTPTSPHPSSRTEQDTDLAKRELHQQEQ